MARVLVAIPTHERPDLLALTFDSVLAQHFADWRVVISDDASSPGCAAAVERLVDKVGDPRVSLTLQPTRLGEYGQGRFLFGQLDAEELFVILHDDDLLDPGYLGRAVERLDAQPEAELFVAGARLIDREGRPRDDLTRDYDQRHGRERLAPGLVPVLVPMLRWGFVPISGTVFRVSALVASGFVDAATEGNYPFELDLVLGLGARGARAWLEADRLIAFRWHGVSLRVGLWYDPAIVDAVVTLLSRHRFEGEAESVRRALLGSKLRRQAELRAAAGDGTGARAAIRAALACRRASPRSWLLALALHLLPGPARRVLGARVASGRQRESHG